MEQADLDHSDQLVQASKPELDQRAQAALAAVQALERERLAPVWEGQAPLDHK
jgi:hypothetical protein